MTATAHPHRGRTLGELAATLPATTAVPALALTLSALGSLGPWATVLGVDIAGTSVAQGDGKITPALAVLAGLLLATRNRVAVAMATTASVAVAGVAGYDLVRIERAASTPLAPGGFLHGVHVASVGWGVVATVLGAVVAVVALGAEYVNGR